MEFVQGAESDSARGDAKHRLYVEGSLDEKVMNILLPNQTTIEKFGGSSHMRNVAKSVYKNQKNYYFLVDRDHHSDDEVLQYRNSFPNLDEPNILMWKFREIENYFIIPDFLINSRYLKVSKKILERKIREKINDNYLIDAANHAIGQVICQIYNGLNFRKFMVSGNTNDITEIKSKIMEKSHLNDYISNINNVISIENILSEFEKLSDELSSDIKNNLHFSDKIMKIIKGKNIINKIITTNLFKIDDSDEQILDGEEFILRVIERILTDERNLPDDFRFVKNAIVKKIFPDSS